MIDFGGGTLDVTIMEFGKGVFEVKSTSGDTQLGGTDMNQRIFEYLAERFKTESGIDVPRPTQGRGPSPRGVGNRQDRTDRPVPQRTSACLHRTRRPAENRATLNWT